MRPKRSLRTTLPILVLTILVGGCEEDPPRDDTSPWCAVPGTLRVDGECENRRGASCVADDDCGSFDECLDGTCSPLGEDLELRLVADHPPAADAVGYDSGAEVSIGAWGGAVVDLDGDGRLEVVSGGPLGDVRVYDGDLEERSVDLPTELSSADVYAAYGLDLDGDLDHELVVSTNDHLGLVDWRAGTAVYTDLSAALPTDEPCFVGVPLPADLDGDGDLDLYVSCLVNHEGRANPSQVALDNPPRHNFSLIQDSPGEWHRDDELTPGEPASTLAVASIDWNDDGALDIVIANDHPVSDGVRNPFLREVLGPGAVLEWTPTGYERRPIYGDENTNFGSWMGITEVWVNGVRHLYMSDVNVNALIDLEVDPPERVRTPEALTLLPDTEGALREFAFGWGVAASDLDRDGAQEVFAARGFTAAQLIPDLELPPSFASQQTDLLYSADGDGGFVLTTELHPADQAEENWEFQSRGAFFTDVDLDGQQDLLIFGIAAHETEEIWRGGLLRYRVESRNHERTPPVCTLIPDPWLVPAVVGYGIREVGTDFFRTENSGGQVPVGTSPWPVSTYGAGTLRFASGAQVEFDCEGEPGPITVTEPEGWLQVTTEGSTTHVCIDAAVWGRTASDVRLAHGDAETALSAEPDGCWVGATPSEGFYVRIDDRYVTRKYE